MHRFTLTTLGILLGLLPAITAVAQDADPIPYSENGTEMCVFIDEDGDGFNDLAPDADGDGIPNGLDTDYVQPLDGDGQQHQWKYSDGFCAKIFGFSLDAEMTGYGQGANQAASAVAGPGTGAGFGPGSSQSGGGSDSGESQADRAGRRGGRR